MSLYVNIPPSTGGGSFGADTIVNIPNSATTPVAAVEMVSSLPASTAGSEFAKFLISMATNGFLAGSANAASWSIEPTTMRSDLGNAGQTAFNWMMRYNGTDVASIGFNSNGQLILTGLGSGSGGISLKVGTAGDQSIAGQFAFISAQKGMQVQTAPVQEHQFTNVASANNLTVPPALGGGGNVGNITGTTQVNLLDSSNYQNGMTLSLFTVSALTLKHNQAPSGNFLPMILKGAADIAMGAGARIMFKLLGANSGTAPVAWYDFTGQVI